MGGFAGSLPTPEGQRALGAMAGTLPGAQRARRAPLAVHGRRDIALHEEDGAALALSGYARVGETPLDAAELLRRFRAHGPEALEPLAGEFALAVTAPEGTWVARDRIGCRPLYVATAGGAVAFATSMRSLLAAGAPGDVDGDAIVRSLILGYVPAPRTAVAAIRQVGAGECWQLAPKERVYRYFRPRERITRGRTLAAAARRLDGALDLAVRTSLPSEGRVGAFLSGGIDSSLVLARLHELGRPVEAFTLHFGDHLPGEIRYAEAVARHLGVPHHVMELDGHSFADAIEPALFELEDLLSEPIAVPNFLLARRAARRVDVLFTGEGGDPCFGGPKNIGLVLASMYPSAPPLAQSYCSAHHHLFDDLAEALTPELRARFDFARLRDELIDPHLQPRRAPGSTFVGRLMAANLALKGGNNILVKVAKMVGAHDLALRSPLFAPEICDLALTIPPWQKLFGSDEKLVMKRVAARSLPRPVVERPKRGMAVPLSKWLRGTLGTMARDVLTERRVRERGVFRWPYVRRLLAREDRPTELARSRSAEKLWLVLVTELYLATLQKMAAARREAA
jgi:asparagine synthase (glutamine-hydrolysing)